MTYRRKDVWTSKTRNKLVKPVYRPTRIIIMEANTHTAHTQTSSDHKTHTRSTEKEKKEKKRGLLKRFAEAQTKPSILSLSS